MWDLRPRWLSLLLVAELVVGVFTFAVAVYYIQLIYAFTSSIGMSPSRFPDFYSYFGVLGAAGAGAFVVAFGAWMRKPWALTTAAYFGVAYLVFCVGFGSYFVGTYGDYTELEAGLPLLVVSLALVFSADRPGVKALFAGAGVGGGESPALRPQVEEGVGEFRRRLRVRDREQGRFQRGASSETTPRGCPR